MERRVSVDALHMIADELEQSGAPQEWCQTTRKKLKEGKRYLKTDYRAHCREEDSSCPKHCRGYSLSDPDNSDFQASLKNTLFSVLSEIESSSMSFYSTEQNEDLLHDPSQAQDILRQWKVYILRTLKVY